MARISIFSGDIFENIQWEGHPGVSDSTYHTCWPVYQQARLGSCAGGVLDVFLLRTGMQTFEMCFGMPLTSVNG